MNECQVWWCMSVIPVLGRRWGCVPQPPTSWPSLFWGSSRLMRCPVSKDKQASSGHHMLAHKYAHVSCPTNMYIHVHMARFFPVLRINKYSTSVWSDTVEVIVITPATGSRERKAACLVTRLGSLLLSGRMDLIFIKLHPQITFNAC